MRRRAFLRRTAGLLAGLASARAARTLAMNEAGEAAGGGSPGRRLKLFLAGDVMTGRGIDQALPHSVSPELHESWVRSARDYVALAEAANGPLSLPLDFAYPWGDALAELERASPVLRLVNLETAVTAGGEPSPEKGIHYRMHPGNVACLAAAGLDGVSLANNHVLDWGEQGLTDSLRHLTAAGIGVAGAGFDLEAASAPCVLATDSGRLLFFGACTGFSGVPHSWAAGPGRPGVNRIGLAGSSVRAIAEAVSRARQPGDSVVLSLHWGANWGYEVDPDQQAFAHRLIDEAGVDLVHGHSSHHPKGIELYRDKVILYGCGDFLNDYEGIRNRHDAFRGELTAMYFPTLDGVTGRLVDFELVPLRIRRFRLQHASVEEAQWLATTLDRESRLLGARVELGAEHRLRVLPA